MNAVFTACLGLGSNLGDRLNALAEAIDHLRQHESIQIDNENGVSSVYKTSPVGVPETQQDYYNAALRVKTSMLPEELLQACLQIENQMGRIRQRRNGSRVIDIDLLLFEDVVMETDLLTLPHPRMHERLFVLIPLCEIAGDTIHPSAGKSIRALCDDLLQHKECTQNPQHRERIDRIHPAGWFQSRDEIASKI